MQLSSHQINICQSQSQHLSYKNIWVKPCVRTGWWWWWYSAHVPPYMLVCVRWSCPVSCCPWSQVHIVYWHQSAIISSSGHWDTRHLTSQQFLVRSQWCHHMYLYLWYPLSTIFVWIPKVKSEIWMRIIISSVFESKWNSFEELQILLFHSK